MNFGRFFSLVFLPIIFINFTNSYAWPYGSASATDQGATAASNTMPSSVIDSLNQLASRGVGVNIQADAVTTDSLNNVAHSAYALSKSGIPIDFTAPAHVSKGLTDAGNGLSAVADQGVQLGLHSSVIKAAKAFAIIGVGLGMSALGLKLLYESCSENRVYTGWIDRFKKPVLGTAALVAGLALVLKSDAIIEKFA